MVRHHALSDLAVGMIRRHHAVVVVTAPVTITLLAASGVTTAGQKDQTPVAGQAALIQMNMTRRKILDMCRPMIN